ncbi:murein biosynthesis integral membrane protein MurJ [Candidatus Legionella polyplacis]|uniref:Probable lipid II flippase MurJ n=1 Tax=Candidatus Legionella polyplacis TaxID=2005262 RepID=A0ABZ2GXE7_9GAMM
MISLKKHNNSFYSIILIAINTLFSRILGVFRDIVLANLFGVQSNIDVFYVVFRILNVIKCLFSENAFVQILIPILFENHKDNSFFLIKDLISRIIGKLVLVFFIVSVIGIFVSPLIVFVFAPGFIKNSEHFYLASEMLKIILPLLVFIPLTAMSSVILNIYGFFGVSAIAPVIVNISLILFALYLSPYFKYPVLSLSWGVLISGIIQFLFQLSFLYKKKLLFTIKIVWNDLEVNNILKLMIPGLFGVSILQINIIIDLFFSSFLSGGSIVWLYYTDRLINFPIGVFGVSVSTVIFPRLSKVFFKENKELFFYILDKGFRLILLIAIPSTIGLIYYSKPLIAICFFYGNFSFYDLLQTQKSLIIFSFGIPAFMLTKVLSVAFYASRDSKTPLKITVFSTVFNCIFCLFFIKNLTYIMLAFMSVISGYINFGFLLFFLVRFKLYYPLYGWRKFIIQLIMANLVVVSYLYTSLDDVNTLVYLTQTTIYMKLITLFQHIALIIIIYWLVLYIVGIRLSDLDFRLKKNNYLTNKI